MILYPVCQHIFVANVPICRNRESLACVTFGLDEVVFRSELRIIEEEKQQQH